MTYADIVVMLIALAIYVNFFMPKTVIEPVYSASVRAPKDRSGLYILMFVFLPLLVAIVVGAAQRLTY